MIDTVKLLIPITDIKFLERIKKKLTRTRREHMETKQLEYEFFTSEVQVGSHDRKVKIYLSEGNPLGFFVEFSVPKQKYNNNIEMVHASDVPAVLENFRTQLCEHLKDELPPLSVWLVYRLDVCYNWTFESKEKCQSLMGFIQRIDFPRKKKYLYDTSVMYKGTAYTIKFYLKGAEFQKHDFKALRDLGESKVYKLFEWAHKVLRFEVEFKKGYLKSVFDKEKVFVVDIADDFEIEEILKEYLALVFRYINKESAKAENIWQLISENFSKAKAYRLYNFYRDYYYEEAGKARVKSSLDRATIYRYKKDLKKIGVSFTENLGDEKFVSVEELVIPSDRAHYTLLAYEEQK